MIRTRHILLILILAVPTQHAFADPTVRGRRTFAEVAERSAALPSLSSYSVTTADVIWLDSGRNRTIPLRIYCPSDRSERFPVVVFSTGLGRSREDCAYLGRHWASCGYVAVHVQHKGSDEQARQAALRPKKGLQRAFYDPENIRNRPLDIIFVLDRLEKLSKEDAYVAERLNLSRIGVAGHDFGAQTVLALAGQVLPGYVTIADPRVKAVVAMSSPVPLGQVPLDTAYANISRPCLHITGTADNSIVATTTAPQRRLPFDLTQGADQYLITFFGADHLVYSGHVRASNGAFDAMFQRRIAECSAVFWDAYLKDNLAARQWLADQGLSDYLKSVARVEKKLPSVQKTAEAPLPEAIIAR